LLDPGGDGLIIPCPRELPCQRAFREGRPDELIQQQHHHPFYYYRQQKNRDGLLFLKKYFMGLLYSIVRGVVQIILALRWVLWMAMLDQLIQAAMEEGARN